MPKGRSLGTKASDNVKYALLSDSKLMSTMALGSSVDKGTDMTPVDPEHGEDDSQQETITSEDGTKDIARNRTFSVSESTQTKNGKVETTPVLLIPGETGELADLSADLPNAVNIKHSHFFRDKEKLNKILAKMKAKKYKYKLIFTISVATLLLISYASMLFPWFLPYYHTVMFPLLVLIRVVVYSRKHWQLFCLDFCYFGNIALLIFCWAFPKSEAYFAVVFGAVTGPMAIAVLVFRNSVVYHDYDRMTSAYIHLVPVLIVYMIKWFPKETTINWYFSQDATFLETSMYTDKAARIASYLPNWVDPSWLWITGVPLVWFFLHTVLYMFVENCVIKNKKYLTSYRWLTGNKKSAIFHILTLGGRLTNQHQVKLSWLTFNMLYAILSVLGARLFYEYFYAHTAYVILLYLIAIFNGASFYIDVFAKTGIKET